MIENAKKRVLLNLSNIAEIREADNGIEISTTTHDDKFYVNVPFNVLIQKLGFNCD